MSDQPSGIRGAEHPDAIRIAAYAEGRLGGDDRAAMEAHLAECADCRAEATEVALLLREPAALRRRWIGIPAAVAAAAAAVVLLAGPFRDSSTAGDALRRPGVEADREAVPAIEVILPSAGDPIPMDSARFVWHGLGADVLYRFTLTDPSGAVLWERELADTALVLSAETRLPGGGRFLWYVDASLPDGGVATTGVRELRTR